MVPDSEISRSELARRLLISGTLNVGLLVTGPVIASWSTIERERLLIFVASSIGASAIVCVAPLVWRGKAWVPAVALLLMVFPALSLLLAVGLFFRGE